VHGRRGQGEQALNVCGCHRAPAARSKHTRTCERLAGGAAAVAACGSDGLRDRLGGLLRGGAVAAQVLGQLRRGADGLRLGHGHGLPALAGGLRCSGRRGARARRDRNGLRLCLMWCGVVE
jgi:hypothetical protein